MKYSETIITMSDGERYSRHSKDLQIILIKKTMPINQMPPDGGMLYKETDMAQFFTATARIPSCGCLISKHLS